MVTQQQIKQSLNWTNIKEPVSNLTKEELVLLVKDLFQRSKDNKAFLNARFTEDKSPILNHYIDQVKKHLTPNISSYKKFKVTPVKKLIKEYKDASRDLSGTLELMFVTIEFCVYLIVYRNYYDEPFYNMLMSTLSEFHKIVLSKEKKYLEPYISRIVELRKELVDKLDYYDDVDKYLSKILEVYNNDS